MRNWGGPTGPGRQSGVYNIANLTTSAAHIFQIPSNLHSTDVEILLPLYLNSADVEIVEILL